MSTLPPSLAELVTELIECWKEIAQSREMWNSNHPSKLYEESLLDAHRRIEDLQGLLEDITK